MLALVVMRVAIDDHDILELAVARLFGGMRQQLARVEFLDRYATAAISDEIHGVSPVSARREGRIRCESQRELQLCQSPSSKTCRSAAFSSAPHKIIVSVADTADCSPKAEKPRARLIVRAIKFAQCGNQGPVGHGVEKNRDRRSPKLSRSRQRVCRALAEAAVSTTVSGAGILRSTSTFGSGGASGVTASGRTPFSIALPKASFSAEESSPRASAARRRLGIWCARLWRLTRRCRPSSPFCTTSYLRSRTDGSAIWRPVRMCIRSRATDRRNSCPLARNESPIEVLSGRRCSSTRAMVRPSQAGPPWCRQKIAVGEEFVVVAEHADLVLADTDDLAFRHS